MIETQNIECKEKFTDRTLKKLCAFANTKRGTLYIGRIIDSLKSQGLLEPEFKEEMGGFSVRFYKDIYTEENLRNMGLTERQIKAVLYVKEKGKITNKKYQEINNTTKKTASRDLSALVDKEILGQIGETGKGTHYVLIKRKLIGDKGDTKGTNGQ